MLDFLFLTGQVVSALLLLYGGYLAFFYGVTASVAPVSCAEEVPTRTARSSAA
jgi:hypothetical protein